MACRGRHLGTRDLDPLAKLHRGLYFTCCLDGHVVQRQDSQLALAWFCVFRAWWYQSDAREHFSLYPRASRYLHIDKPEPHRQQKLLSSNVLPVFPFIGPTLKQEAMQWFRETRHAFDVGETQRAKSLETRPHSKKNSLWTIKKPDKPKRRRSWMFTNSLSVRKYLNPSTVKIGDGEDWN